jgi:AraC-like DNA-binding protein
MVRVKKPAALLRHLVRYYVHVEDRFTAQPRVQPVPARTAVAIEFTLAEPFEVRCGGSPPTVAHPVAVIGAQTYRRVHLSMQGGVETFVIVFQPGGLARLFSIPSDLLTDQDFDGHAVLGRSVAELRSRLGESASFEERVQVADAYLLQRPAAHSRPDSIGVLARGLLSQGGRFRVSRMADAAGLSVRQFERRFIAQMGIPPRLYARIARFEAALKIKMQSPCLRWTDIAHQLEYYDHMHMVHDFQQLSGSTPSEVAPQLDIFVQSDIDGTRP